ncbi:hypothetical protein RCH14_000949 [Massilia sp. MP_M2]|uniref:hypothetical protein n=1 Tax=Massilia sp. MP_M2 TaxID=3071713 RepID=UPI00319E1558
MFKSASLVVGLCGILILQGCNTAEQANPWKASSTKHVRIQVCLPTKVVKFEDLVLNRLENHPTSPQRPYSQAELEIAPKTVRRMVPVESPRAIDSPLLPYEQVRKRSGFSIGRRLISLEDSTIADQPVFEEGFTQPVSELVAFAVLIRGKETKADEATQYWYTLPKEIPVGVFSGWLAPISMIPPGYSPHPSFSLTRGGMLPIFPVHGDTPKMRVSLVEPPTYKRSPATDFLPALYTARTKFKSDDSGRFFVYEFVEKSGERIPACE